MLSSIIRRSTVHSENNGRSPKINDSPKIGSREYYDRILAKLAGESGETSHSEGTFNFSDLPVVIESCSCSYFLGIEGNDMESTRIDGRLYCTPKNMYFVGLNGTNVIMHWKEAVNCFITVPNAITIHYRTMSGDTSSHILGRFNQKREKLLRLINQLIQDASSRPDTSNDTEPGDKIVETRRRLRTVDVPVFDNKSQSITFVSPKQQERRQTSSDLSSEVVNRALHDSVSRPRTFSEPGPALTITETKSELDDHLSDGSVILPFSDSVDMKSPTSDDNTYPERAPANTMPAMRVSQKRDDVESMAVKVAPSRTYGRQDSMTSVSSYKRHKVKSMKGKKRSKVEGENQGQIDGLNLQRISAVHRSIFINHFGGDPVSSPQIVLTYSCAYYPKNADSSVWPLLHGRMFCTYEKMYFVGWQSKRIVLPWDDVTSLERQSTAWNTIPNAIRFFYKDENDMTCSYFFGSFLNREASYTALQNLMDFRRMQVQVVRGSLKGTSLRNINLRAASGRNISRRNILPKMHMSDETPVPADERMSQMTPVANKRFKNVSISDFFNICWGDGAESDCGSSYENFLKQTGLNDDIIVGKWKSANDGETSEFYHAWSEEYYSMKRTVSRQFKRQTHLYVGPPVATVHETQFCRIDGDKKLIIAMSVELDGIPFGDSFTVEIRLVARRDGTALIVEVGLSLNFKRRVLLAAKIRSGTIEEMGPFALSLVDYCKRSCEKYEEDGDSKNDMSNDSNGESMMDKAGEEMSLSFRKIDMRCGLRCILIQFYSLFDISKNILSHVQFTHILIAICTIIFYLIMDRKTPTTCYLSGESDELSHKLMALSEEINQLRIELKKHR